MRDGMNYRLPQLPDKALAAWNFIFKPEAAIKEAGRRRQAEALAVTATLVFVLNTLSVISSAISGRSMDGAFLAQISISVLAEVCYGLARTKHYRAGLWILLGGAFAAAFSGLAFSSGEASGAFLRYLPLLLLLPLGFLTLREVLWVSGITFTATLLAAYYAGGLSAQAHWQLVGLVFSAGLLVSAAAAARSSVERARLSEAVRANEKLQQSCAALEMRAAELERALALASEIGRNAAQGSDPGALLALAVEKVREYFGLYYVQVYLADAANRSLQLRAGSGDVGAALLRSGHRVPVDLSSVSGTAALERRVVVVENTISARAFRSHPLLPFTRSEICVPLLAGERVLGVLDLQSRSAGELNPGKAPVFEAFAAALASALVNADLLSQLQEAAAEQAERAQSSVREGWRSFLDAIHTRERIAYIYEGDTIRPLDTALRPSEDPCRLTVPMQLSGVTMGFFQFESDRPWTEEETRLAGAVAAQVAQQVENLRLLGQADAFRREAEGAVQRLTGREWHEYTREAGEGRLSFIYAGDQVESLENAPEIETPGAQVDIRVNNQPVGQMGISGVEELSPQDAELVETVTRQLAAHLENIRLFRSAQRQLSERHRTEDQLEYQRRNLQAVLDNMAAGVFMVEVPSGKPILYNRKVQELLGRPILPDATIDEFSRAYQAYRFGTDELYPSREIPAVAAMEGFSANIEDMEIRRPDGARLLLNVTGSPVYDGEGSLAASVVVFQDITERRQAEDLIAKRAVQLATVSEVATVISTISDPDEMLQTVVDMTRGSFDFYHTQIYLVNQAGDMLVMSKGAGLVGRRLVIEAEPIELNSDCSVAARAARLREGLIVNHIRREPGLMPHLLLPETQAEMAIPLMVGDQLLGVLDVQSDREGNFSEEDIFIGTTLASQVAVSLQNARSYARAQRQAEREALINAISEQIQSTGTIESALQAAVREIGRALGARKTSIRLGLEPRDDNP